MMSEHTCGGMYDLSCEACWELQCQAEANREELPGESRYFDDDLIGNETDCPGF